MDQKLATTENITRVLTSLGFLAIPFRQNIAGHLLINARLNGIDGVYLLDTGAGRTVIDAAQIDNLKLKLNYDESVNTGGGVGAHSLENIPSYDNDLEIGEYNAGKVAVAVMSLATAWESLSTVGAHDELFGIIGVDILRPGQGIIDFGTMTLYLKQA